MASIDNEFSAMALQASRPPSSLFVSPRRASNGDGGAKKKKNAFVCPSCRSTEYTKLDGTLICNLCGTGVCHFIICH